MRIGIFDSGLGGLITAHAIREFLPDYDYVYFGDTLNLPYGGRSKQAVYAHTERAVDYLMRHEECALVILACNTATAHCARLLQQFYLVRAFPHNRILGVVVPTLETCVAHGHKRIGMLATAGMIESAVYQEELGKIDPAISFSGIASPLLVPMIENGGHQWIGPILDNYLSPLLEQNIDSLILGCTHYPILKQEISERIGKNIELVSQDEIIPQKLADYLSRHNDMDGRLGKGGTIKYLVSDITETYKTAARNIIQSDIMLEKPRGW